MADLYNIVFDGELLNGADPAAARAKLASTFRLDGPHLDNLFSGRRIVVKRDIDLLTATRFQQAFLAAGARADIESVDGEPDALPIAATDTWDGDDAAASHDDGPLSLAPPGAPLDEIDDRGPPRSPDTSALGLVPAAGWDLTDCAPPPPAIPQFDLDGLALLPIDPAAARLALDARGSNTAE
jgi:hypothetical protein